MVGFHITTPRLNRRQLMVFVKGNMPATSELIRRARLANLPETCQHCGASLFSICKRYEHIPTKDAGLTFPEKAEAPQVMQLASGASACRTMREGVCRIVHKHLLNRLRERRISHLAMII